MPYGTTIAVGVFCGLLGLTTYAVTDRAGPATDRPDGTVAAASSLVTVPMVSVDHQPPPRVPSELLGVAANRAVAGHVPAVAPPLQLPIGQTVNVRFVTPIATAGGQITGMSGRLVAIDAEWVHLFAEGKDRLIARSQVMIINIEPAPAAVAAIVH